MPNLSFYQECIYRTFSLELYVTHQLILPLQELHICNLWFPFSLIFTLVIYFWNFTMTTMEGAVGYFIF